MKEIIREAALGQLLRLVSGNRLFRYPEEEPGFQIPFDRLAQQQKLDEINKELHAETAGDATPPEETEEVEKEDTFQPLDHIVTADDTAGNVDVEKARSSRSSRPDLDKVQSVKSLSRTSTTPYSNERLEVEAELAAERTKSLPIQPTITASGQVLVTWYTTDDQDNPQNWSQGKKSYVSFLIW